MTIEVAKGQDWTIQYRILAPERVRLAADAAEDATSLLIQPDHAALASGDKLMYGENVILTLTSACAVGVKTLAVSATPCILPATSWLQKVRDLTGYTLELEVLTRRGDATPLISKTGANVTILNQTAELRGLVEVAGLAADLAAMQPGLYFVTFWRTNAGTKRPLSGEDFKLVESGFL